MGTLQKLGIYDPDPEKAKIKKQGFAESTKVCLQNGGFPLLGGAVKVDLGLGIFPDSIMQSQIEAIDNAPQDDCLKMYKDAYFDCLGKIDSTIPEGKLAASFGLFDPTTPIPPIIDPIIDALRPIIPDPLAWIKENIGKIIMKAQDFADAMVDLANCDLEPEERTEKLASTLNDIDDNLDKEKLKENLVNIPCGFSIPTLPDFGLPFSIGFGLDFELPNFLPIPFGFHIPGFPPNLNFAFINIIKVIIDAINALILGPFIDLLSILFTQGILAFCIAIIEKLLELIIATLKIILEPLMKSLLFVAAISTFLGLILGAFILSLIGLCLGAGLLSFFVAEQFELI